MEQGRIIYVCNNNLLFCEKYTLRDSRGWYPIKDNKFVWLSKLRFIQRFLRAEVTGLYALSDGEKIAIAKKGLFLQKKGLILMLYKE